MFSDEACEALLFLRFVEEIELEVWLPDSAQPRPLLRVAIDNAAEVRSYRSRLTDMADKDNGFLKAVTNEMMKPLFYVYNVSKTSYDFNWQGKTYFSNKTELRQYGVTSLLAGGEAMSMALAEIKKEGKFQAGSADSIRVRSISCSFLSQSSLIVKF